VLTEPELGKIRILAPSAFAAWFAEFASIDPGALEDSTLLVEDLNFDSFALLELWTVLDEAGIDISPERVADVRSFGQLYQYYARTAAFSGFDS
jgi:acyl carrier protein